MNTDNNNLKNLINLSTQIEIPIFNNKQKLKKKENIIKDCEQNKKKELKKSSIMLANLAKLNQVNDLQNIHTIYKNLENKITNIDKMIDCVKILDTDKSIEKNKSIEKSEEFIECYSNC